MWRRGEEERLLRLGDIGGPRSRSVVDLQSAMANDGWLALEASEWSQQC